MIKLIEKINSGLKTDRVEFETESFGPGIAPIFYVNLVDRATGGVIRTLRQGSRAALRQYARGLAGEEKPTGRNVSDFKQGQRDRHILE